MTIASSAPGTHSSPNSQVPPLNKVPCVRKGPIPKVCRMKANSPPLPVFGGGCRLPLMIVHASSTPDFSSARDREPDLEDARRLLWDQKADEFRDNAADLGEAERIVSELLSDEPPASTASTDPQQESREQGWKLRGKDRAPRAPRNRGGRSHDR
jgi:hypothetical protein